MDVQRFLEVEEKYDLNKKKAMNLNYWVYSRFIVESILEQSVDEKEALDTKILGKRDVWRKIPELLIRCIRERMHFVKQKEIIIINHPRRVKNEDGKYVCCYTSELSKCYNNTVLLEAPYRYTHFKPIIEKNIFYTDYIEVLSNIKAQLYKSVCKRKYRNCYTQIETEIGQAIYELVGNDKEKYEKIIRLIVFRTLLAYFRKPYYEKLVKDIKPKLIIEVVSYSLNCMIMNEVAKDYSIPTIELQHGIIGKYHIAYNYGDKIESISQFPDYLFTFGEYWEKTVSPPIMKENVRAVGYPFFEERIKSLQNKKRNKAICFVSQRPIGKKLSKLAVELKSKIDSDWKIYYKLHPGEFSTWKEEYPWLRKSDVLVIGEDGENLYDIFEKCSVQIGVFSTALYEGIGFGLTTLIYKIEWSEIFEELVDKQYARYIENVEDVLESINDRQENDIRKYFWKENALENMRNEINSILDEMMNKEKKDEIL